MTPSSAVSLSSDGSAVPAPHVWKFFRAGGFDQVRLDSGDDIFSLDQLDQKLWLALACPASGIEVDARALGLLDTDRDGRIRAAELLAAVRWLKGVLKSGDILVQPGDSVPLDAIDENSADGGVVLASARTILANLGKPDATVIGLDDTRDTDRIFAQTSFNGDGVIPPAAAADDPTLVQAITDIIACLGGVRDRSGEIGIDQSRVDDFFAQVDHLVQWLVEGEGHRLPEGAGAAFAAIRDKVDGFFVLCRLAAYQPSALLGPSPESLAGLVGLDRAATLAALAPLPLAAVAADAALPLAGGINPAWEAQMAAFRQQVVVPLLGDRPQLDQGEWDALVARFADFETWLAARPVNAVDGLGAERARALADPVIRAGLGALISRDQALEAQAAGIDAVEKLVVLRTHLFGLLNNFVSFGAFYGRRAKAAFQAGTLYLDGRSAELCVRVDDAAKHAGLAAQSRIFLVYCDCQRRGSGEKMTIMAGFTAGDSDRLLVGRNGIFYDRQGRDWDAAVIRVVEHPISMRQAFWAPYKQLARFAGAQLEKVASARAKAVETEMQTKAAAKIAAPATTAAKEPAFDPGRFAGIFAALGLAIGAIGTAIASVVTGFFQLSWWQMPLALVGLVLAVSGPSMLVAYLKLRQRSLAPILDATGWAVNARASINIAFGGALTALAQLPDGASRQLTDPFADKPWPWGRIILALVVVAALALAGAWWAGLVPWLPGRH